MERGWKGTQALRGCQRCLGPRMRTPSEALGFLIPDSRLPAKAEGCGAGPTCVLGADIITQGQDTQEAGPRGPRGSNSGGLFADVPTQRTVPRLYYR